MAYPFLRYLFLGLLGVLPFAPAMAAEARQALVMGVWQYDDAKFPPLPGIEQDVQRMATRLAELGFSVTLVKNPTLGLAKKAVDDFGAQLLAKQGVGLFYFSGHGTENDGKNYLIPRGTAIATRKDLDDEALSAQRVLNRMEEAGTAVNIVFLDCCRNTLTKGSGSLAPMQATGTFIGFATASAKVANAGDGGSPYTTALLKHMATPGISIMDMHAMVTREVKEMTTGGGEVQVPFQYSGLDSAFAFVPGARTTVPPPDPLPPSAPDTQVARTRLSGGRTATFRYPSAFGSAVNPESLPEPEETYRDENFPLQNFIRFTRDPWKTAEVGMGGRTRVDFYEVPAKFKSDKGNPSDDPYHQSAADKQDGVTALQEIYAARSVTLKNRSFADHSLMSLGAAKGAGATAAPKNIPQCFWWGSPDAATDSIAPYYIESADGTWRGIARFTNSGQDIWLNPDWQAIVIANFGGEIVVAEISVPCSEVDVLRPYYTRFAQGTTEGAMTKVGLEVYRLLGTREDWTGDLKKVVGDGEMMVKSLTGP